jgi:hypothetical protein
MAEVLRRSYANRLRNLRIQMLLGTCWDICAYLERLKSECCISDIVYSFHFAIFHDHVDSCSTYNYFIHS